VEEDEAAKIRMPDGVLRDKLLTNLPKDVLSEPPLSLVIEDPCFGLQRPNVVAKNAYGSDLDMWKLFSDGPQCLGEREQQDEMNLPRFAEFSEGNCVGFMLRNTGQAFEDRTAGASEVVDDCEHGVLIQMRLKPASDVSRSRALARPEQFSDFTCG
jgi:hypothetical protein